MDFFLWKVVEKEWAEGKRDRREASANKNGERPVCMNA
jgi:hypothetical protein